MSSSNSKTVPVQQQPPSGANKVLRAVWQVCWFLLYRPTPIFMHGWRCVLLRLFGANVGSGAHPYPTARIWAPWKLTMHTRSCLGSGVECYNVDHVVLGEACIVSQHAYLCTAGHDIDSDGFDLVTAPIKIGAHAWVAAGAYIGPGVTIGDGGVAAARAVVVRNVEAWSVVAGNPAAPVKQRTQHP